MGRMQTGKPIENKTVDFEVTVEISRLHSLTILNAIASACCESPVTLVVGTSRNREGSQGGVTVSNREGSQGGVTVLLLNLWGSHGRGHRNLLIHKYPHEHWRFRFSSADSKSADLRVLGVRLPLPAPAQKPKE